MLLVPWTWYPFCFSLSSFQHTLRELSFRGLMCVKLWWEKRKQIKLWDFYPPISLSYYQSKNLCNYFLPHIHAFEQKSTPTWGFRYLILWLIRTSDYNAASTIINLVTETFCTLTKCQKSSMTIEVLLLKKYTSINSDISKKNLGNRD